MSTATLSSHGGASSRAASSGTNALCSTAMPRALGSRNTVWPGGMASALASTSGDTAGVTSCPAGT